MKKMKKIMQLCLAVMTVITVVSVAKIDTKAATQITGFKQVKGYSNAVELDWDTYNLPAEGYSVVSYRTWGSSEAWKTVTSEYFRDLAPGTSYEMKLAIYSDYEHTNLVAETPNSIEVVTAPGTYTAFAVNQTGATATSATIAWNQYPGANCFQVEYTNNNQVQYVDGNQVTMTNLAANKNAYISVSPCRKSSAGYIATSTSNYKSVSAIVVPATPGIKGTDLDIKNKALTLYTLDKSGYYADGYEYDIYKVKGNKRVALVKPNSSSSICDVKNKAFGSRELFKVKVRAYKKAANGTKYYTPWSSMNYFSTDKILKSVKNKGSKGIEVKWNKVNGASGYKVYAATKNDPKKYKVVATIKKGTTTSTTFKKFNKKALKKGQRYYIFVEPYYKSGKKTIDVVNGYYRYTSIVYKK